MNQQDSLSSNNANKTPAIKYLENLSIVRVKLANVSKLIHVDECLENDTQSTKESETDRIVDINEYIHLTDWVEPSIYFTIFCP